MIVARRENGMDDPPSPPSASGTMPASMLEATRISSTKRLASLGCRGNEHHRRSRDCRQVATSVHDGEGKAGGLSPAHKSAILGWPREVEGLPFRLLRYRGFRMLPSSIPDDLTELDQWVLWRRETVNGRQTKVPYTVGGRRASST